MVYKKIRILPKTNYIGNIPFSLERKAAVCYNNHVI